MILGKSERFMSVMAFFLSKIPFLIIMGIETYDIFYFFLTSHSLSSCLGNIITLRGFMPTLPYSNYWQACQHILKLWHCLYLGQCFHFHQSSIFPGGLFFPSTLASTEYSCSSGFNQIFAKSSWTIFYVSEAICNILQSLLRWFLKAIFHDWHPTALPLF